MLKYGCMPISMHICVSLAVMVSGGGSCLGEEEPNRKAFRNSSGQRACTCAFACVWLYEMWSEF